MRERATIVVDHTSNYRFPRERFRRLAEANGYVLVLVFVDTPVGVIRRRMDANAACRHRAAIRDDVWTSCASGRSSGLVRDENAIVFTPRQTLRKWLQATLAPRPRGNPATR